MGLAGSSLARTGCKVGDWRSAFSANVRHDRRRHWAPRTAAIGANRKAAMTHVASAQRAESGLSARSKVAEKWGALFLEKGEREASKEPSPIRGGVLEPETFSPGSRVIFSAP